MNATQLTSSRNFTRRFTDKLQAAFDSETTGRDQPTNRRVTVEFKTRRTFQLFPDCEERRAFAMYFACGFMAAHNK